MRDGSTIVFRNCGCCIFFVLLKCLRANETTERRCFEVSVSLCGAMFPTVICREQQTLKSLEMEQYDAHVGGAVRDEKSP